MSSKCLTDVFEWMNEFVLFKMVLNCFHSTFFNPFMCSKYLVLYFLGFVFQCLNYESMTHLQETWKKNKVTYQFSSVAQSCQTLCDPMNCSTPGFPVLHQLLELVQAHVHWVGDAIQPSHPLSSPSPPAFNLSQHQGLFQWVSSSHQGAKALEFQLQHQSFQWIFRTEFL